MKVVPDYKGVVTEMAEAGDKVGVDRALADTRKRARQWLASRGEEEPGAGGSAWRPRKRHRVASGEVLMEMDNQLRVSSLGKVGLANFEVPEAASPFDWPSLSVARDGGSDLCCPLSFLQRHLGLNVDETYDPSHAGWRSVIAALKAVGLWGHMTVMVTVFNVPHGAWGDDLRYRQAVAALEEKARHEGPHTDPLFQDLMSEMLADKSWSHRAGEALVAEELWEEVILDGPWRRKGRRLTMNRFLGAIEESLKEEKVWSQREFVYTYLCLELDMLKDRKLVRTKAVDQPQAGAGGSGGDRVRMRDAGAELKLLKANCQNAMVLACMSYMNKTNRALTRLISFVSKPCLDWHADQNRRLRDTDSSIAWTIEQGAGAHSSRSPCNPECN